MRWSAPLRLLPPNWTQCLGTDKIKTTSLKDNRKKIWDESLKRPRTDCAIYSRATRLPSLSFHFPLLFLRSPLLLTNLSHPRRGHTGTDPDWGYTGTDTGLKAASFRVARCVGCSAAFSSCTDSTSTYHDQGVGCQHIAVCDLNFCAIVAEILPKMTTE